MYFRWNREAQVSSVARKLRLGQRREHPLLTKATKSTSAKMPQIGSMSSHGVGERVTGRRPSGRGVLYILEGARRGVWGEDQPGTLLDTAPKVPPSTPPAKTFLSSISCRPPLTSKWLPQPCPQSGFLTPSLLLQNSGKKPQILPADHPQRPSLVPGVQPWASHP